MKIIRQMERKNLKKTNDFAKCQVSELGRMNNNLNAKLVSMQNNLLHNENKLKTLNDIIVAMTINDIRNHNYTSEVDVKKVISIPYSFLHEVTKKYIVNIVFTKDCMTIEPIKVEDESKVVDADEEGVTSDKIESGNAKEITGGTEDTIS